MYDTILLALQIISAIGIIGLVLLQQQDTGFYSSNSNINRTRRGIEKVTYNMTIAMIIVFVASSILNFVI